MTGTRYGASPQQMAVLVGVFGLTKTLAPYEVHHGDCIGVDEQIHKIAKMSRVMQPEIRIICHPPNAHANRAFTEGANETREVKSYRDRDYDIVDESERLLAVPLGWGEQLRSGTWMTVRYARSQGKPVCLVYPDGSVIWT